MKYSTAILLTLCFIILCDGKLATEFHGYPVENIDLKQTIISKLIEGDILVEPRVNGKVVIGSDFSTQLTNRRRGLTLGSIWPNGIIPYVIHPALSSYKSLIESSMREWENGTCLSFVPYDKSKHGLVYLDIRTKNNFGCYTKVGYKRPRRPVPSPHLVNLAPGCFWRLIILHELGHVIGFYHEHSRPDRDDHVKILWDNIIPGYETEFKKYPINSLGHPYDLKSLMHYGPKMFSRNGKDTIQSLDPRNPLILNQYISVSDREQVNDRYNCRRRGKRWIL
ncbi:zinc metalloproteinase nas-4-like [Xenia sp. Carnegie-2017]|uniref:zinc metalloproteinase nas-4-like n=1 Tax=Xenia sp. Carnegie-2017 TaxID=2897299 RepID=UPI001F038B30|nr:zinc metalloproteinase nas-4-like [Xenia sp. Carnegie-2017]